MCTETKPLEYFHEGNGSYCKECRKDYVREHSKGYVRKKKTTKISKFRALSNGDIEALFIGGKNLKDIAKMFNITSGAVSLEITKRSQDKPLRRSDLIKMYQNDYAKMSEIKEDDLFSVGAWTQSSNKKSFVNAGLMTGKSLKYN